MYGTCCQHSSSLDKLFFDESENKFLYREHWISRVKSTIFPKKKMFYMIFVRIFWGSILILSTAAWIPNINADLLS